MAVKQGGKEIVELSAGEVEIEASRPGEPSAANRSSSRLSPVAASFCQRSCSGGSDGNRNRGFHQRRHIIEVLVAGQEKTLLSSFCSNSRSRRPKPFREAFTASSSKEQSRNSVRGSRLRRNEARDCAATRKRARLPAGPRARQRRRRNFLVDGACVCRADSRSTVADDAKLEIRFERGKVEITIPGPEPLKLQGVYTIDPENKELITDQKRDEGSGCSTIVPFRR